MSTDPFFLAVFSNAWMLAWASAASIPLLIHFFSRRYRREIRWAATQFLIAARQKSARRFQFWQWLLLLLRMAVIVLLAIALADPLVRSEGQTSDGLLPRLEIIVLDASLSMQREEEGRSCWEKAIAHASQICAQSRDGDGFMLLKMGTIPKWLFDGVSVDSREVQRILDSTFADDTVADPMEMIAEIQRIHADADDRARWLGERRITVLTDLQATTWAGLPDSVAVAGNQVIDVIDVASKTEVPSVSVSEIRVEQSMPVGHEPLTIRSVITNHADVAIDSTLVQLTVDDTVQDSKRIGVSGNSQATIQWSTMLPEGDHIVGVRVERDDLAPDNDRRMRVTVKPEVKIACVGPNLKATQFLVTALQSGAKSIDVVAVDSDSLHLLEIESFDLVMLCDCAAVSQADVTRLRQHVMDGGSLMNWLGPRCDATSMNRMLSEPSSISIARIVGVAESGQYRIDPIGYSHPIVQPFKAFPDSGLLTTPIFRYWKLIAESDNEGHDVLRIGSEGDPLFSVRQFASGGSVAVVATSPTVEGEQPWSALAVWPSFIPLLHEGVAFAVSSQSQRQFVAGESCYANTSGSGPRADFVIKSPAGLLTNLPPTSPGANLLIPPRAKVGVYEVLSDGAVLEAITVNSPVEESSVEKLSESGLPSGMRLINPKSLRLGNDSLGAVDYAVDRRLFPLILALAVVCLLAESLISRTVRARFA